MCLPHVKLFDETGLFGGPTVWVSHQSFDLSIPSSSGVSIEPGTAWSRRSLTSKRIWITEKFVVIGPQEIRKIGMVNITAMRLFGRGTFERVCRSFVDEPFQEFTFCVRQQHE